jgi:hypothetical protein
MTAPVSPGGSGYGWMRVNAVMGRCVKRESEEARLRARRGVG